MKKYLTCLSFVCFALFSFKTDKECDTILEQLKRIGLLKVKYEEALDFPRKDRKTRKNCRLEYLKAIENFKNAIDNNIKCLDNLIATTPEKLPGDLPHINYVYQDPLSSYIPPSYFITQLDYLKLCRYSFYEVNSDTLIPASKAEVLFGSKYQDTRSGVLPIGK